MSAADVGLSCGLCAACGKLAALKQAMVSYPCPFCNGSNQTLSQAYVVCSSSSRATHCVMIPQAVLLAARVNVEAGTGAQEVL